MRVEFPERIKTLVASRSAYECSFPNCGLVTIGPGLRPEQVSVTGVAAHIFSASPKGPRGQSGLSIDWLSSAENAIWLCETHAKLIDNNRGQEYPPAVLVGYKSLHEMRIIRRQRGIIAPLGWFHELHVKRGPVFSTPMKVRFGKVTFLFGDNGTGKSALWEWLVALADPSWSLRRWRKQMRNDLPLEFETTYFDPVKHTVDVSVSLTGDIRYCLDSQEVMFHPFPIRFVNIRHPEAMVLGIGSGEVWERMDDLQRIAATLHVDPLAVENSISAVPKLGGMAKNLQVKNRDERDSEEEEGDSADAGHTGEHRPRKRLMVKFGRGPELSFSMLSSGEQIEVLVEIAVTLAIFWAQYVPTVLIFSNVTMLDRSLLLSWAERLSGADYLFQTIIEVPDESDFVGQITLGNWEIVSLSGRPPKVSVNQRGADN